MNALKSSHHRAAGLLESLSQNHPFIDGNKRTAVTAAFLRANGYRFDFNDLDAYRFLIELYETSQFHFEKLEPWLRQNAKSAT